MAIGMLAGALSMSCGATHARRLASSVVIPFELRNDLPLVLVSVNGVKALLALDTGSGAIVLDSAFAEEVGVHILPAVTVLANGRTRIRVGLTDSVTLGRTAAITRATTAIVDLSPVQRRVGFDVHGTIGYDLFRSYVVTVDYPARTITLDDPTTFRYTGTGIPLGIRVVHNVPVVDALLVTRHSGTLPASLHVDLGSTNFALRLSSRFLAAHPIESDTATVPIQLGAGVGGVDHGRLLRLPSARLGSLVIGRPSTALSLEHSGAFGDDAPTDGTIGAPVFRRTRITIDYSRSRIYIEPVSRLDLPDSVDASGLTLIRADPGATGWTVEAVIPNSAATLAGIQAGDIVDAIDGTPVADLAPGELQLRLRHAGQRCRLSMTRGGQSRTVTIALRPIV